MRIFLFVLIGFYAASCTISGEQEEQLNNQLGRYIEAHNNSDNQLLQLVGMTHPEIVRYYKNQGDSTFVFHFKDLKNGEKTFLQNPTYRDMVTEGKVIHRKYWVEYFTQTTEINHRYGLYAISRDGGNNWYFLREDEYYNSSIKGFKRLMKKHT